MCVENVFPTYITPRPGQDSNTVPYTPDPDTLTTRPQRPYSTIVMSYMNEIR